MLAQENILNNGLVQTTAAINGEEVDAGIRFVGSNPNNYVYFNCKDKYNEKKYGSEGYDYENACEIWRIIGVFDVEKTTGGTPEKRLKILGNTFTDGTGNVLGMSWDSSASDINGGSGINQWGESTYSNGNSYEGADIMRMLNGYYIGEEDTCKYCNAAGQATCSNNCTSIVNVINDRFVNMIDSVNWNTNSVEYATVMKPDDTYEQEISEQETSINSILHTSSWYGKVGLISVSDYGYAASNCTDLTEETCGINNWLNDLISNTDSFWTINYASNTDNVGSVVWFVNTGRIRYSISSSYKSVFPSLYLKSNVVFIGDGNGTEESPYILGINE